MLSSRSLQRHRALPDSNERQAMNIESFIEHFNWSPIATDWQIDL